MKQIKTKLLIFLHIHRLIVALCIIVPCTVFVWNFLFKFILWRTPNPFRYIRNIYIKVATPEQLTLTYGYILLEHGLCHSACPTYELRVDHMGNVTLDLIAYTKMRDVNKKYQKKISPEKVTELMEAFNKYKFELFEGEYYDNRILAGQGDIVIMYYSPSLKKIVRYDPLDFSIPNELEKLESEIRRITGLEQWFQELGYAKN